MKEVISPTMYKIEIAGPKFIPHAITRYCRGTHLVLPTKMLKSLSSIAAPERLKAYADSLRYSDARLRSQDTRLPLSVSDVVVGHLPVIPRWTATIEAASSGTLDEFTELWLITGKQGLNEYTGIPFSVTTAWVEG